MQPQTASAPADGGLAVGPVMRLGMTRGRLAQGTHRASVQKTTRQADDIHPLLRMYHKRTVIVRLMSGDGQRRRFGTAAERICIRPPLRQPAGDPPKKRGA